MTSSLTLCSTNTLFIAMIMISLSSSMMRAAQIPNQRDTANQVLDWIKKDDGLTKSTEDLCAICRRDYSEFEGLKLMCDHKFHQTCLYKWIWEDYHRLGRGCPICSAKALDEDLDFWFRLLNKANDKFVAKIKEEWGVMARYNYDLFQVKDYVAKNQMN